MNMVILDFVKVVLTYECCLIVANLRRQTFYVNGQ